MSLPLHSPHRGTSADRCDQGVASKRLGKSLLTETFWLQNVSLLER